jgi:MoaA/NifB/PqqE/SkfB family radical SAM enzyme
MKKRDCCEIILNHACDLRCGFCSQADFSTASHMKPADAVRHIYAAKKAGFSRLGFSGGEALLRRDLPQLVKAARKVGFRAVRLQTNGTALAAPAAARKLVKAGLTVCKFTFASHLPAVHDRLVGKSGAFTKSLAGLDNMLALKAAVGVNLLVTRANYRSLPETLGFFMRRGAAAFVLIYPLYEGAMARSKNLRVSLPQAGPFIVEALRLASAAGLGGEVKALNAPPCVLPGFEGRAAGLYRFNTVVIAADGGARDLDDCVAASKLQGAPCARCYFGGTCSGIDRNYLAVFGWKGIRPVLNKPAPAPRRAGPLLTNNEKCFAEILRGGRELGTAAILAAARKLPLCRGCSDGSHVLLTGQALVKRGLARRRLARGVYYWRLKDA